MVATANFDFLQAHDSTLVRLGGLAERYFRDDPITALVKLRQFVELLSKPSLPTMPYTKGSGRPLRTGFAACLTNASCPETWLTCSTACASSAMRLPTISRVLTLRHF